MRIIQHSEITEWTEYRLEFDRVANPGSGFSFPCDEVGTPGEMPQAAIDNLAKCRANPETYRFLGVKKRVTRGRTSTIGRCDCGTKVYLDGFTNECLGCGRLYNWAGQELAPVEQWGEETREHPADILNIK
jgi:hypothetical protein